MNTIPSTKGQYADLGRPIRRRDADPATKVKGSPRFTATPNTGANGDCRFVFQDGITASHIYFPISTELESIKNLVTNRPGRLTAHYRTPPATFNHHNTDRRTRMLHQP